jgi:hypothetical protein
MDKPFASRTSGALTDHRIDEVRRIFELAVTLDAARREQWLLENVPDEAIRHVVMQLIAADSRPGVLDVSVLKWLDAICFPGAQAAARARAGALDDT